MPTWSMHCATLAGLRSRLTPRVSTTSADPQRLETERFPCLATLSPAPATTNAVAVETLNVPDASPPVPAVSMSISRSVPASAVPTSRPRPHPHGLEPHDLREADQLLDGLPLHPEGGEERRDLDGGGGPGHERLHRGGGLEPREVAPLHQRSDRFHDDGTGHGSSLPYPVPAGSPEARDDFLNVLEPEGLGHHAVDAVRLHLVRLDLDAPAGHEHDRHLGPGRLHGLRHLPAGHAGHGQIGHHQVERRSRGSGRAPRCRRRPRRPGGAAGGGSPPACLGRTARRR